MGQVPEQLQIPEYLVIGNGRLARHILHYFSLLNIQAAHWYRGMESAIPEAKRYLVLISDNAIEEFIAENLRDKTGIKIHCSGALTTPLAVGAHPLTTFSPDLYTAEKYKEIFFILDANAPDFAELLPGLPNPHARLDPALKAKYHAHCVMAANYSCLLWQKLFHGFENEFRLPPEAAFPLLQQQTENILRDWKNALTGPLVRGDTATISRNLDALEGDAYRNIYQTFVDSYGKETSC